MSTVKYCQLTDDYSKKIWILCSAWLAGLHAMLITGKLTRRQLATLQQWRNYRLSFRLM